MYALRGKFLLDPCDPTIHPIDGVGTEFAFEHVNEELAGDRSPDQSPPPSTQDLVAHPKVGPERFGDGRVKSDPGQLSVTPALSPDQKPVPVEVEIRYPEPQPLDATQSLAQTEKDNEPQMRVRSGDREDRLNGVFGDPSDVLRGAPTRESDLVEDVIATEPGEVPQNR
jgi:hypothetical protein